MSSSENVLTLTGVVGRIYSNKGNLKFTAFAPIFAEVREDKRQQASDGEPSARIKCIRCDAALANGEHTSEQHSNRRKCSFSPADT